MIITISREYGSGGRRIGQQLANLLNIAYYDREIVAKAAETSGYPKEIHDCLDERPANRLLYAISMFNTRNLSGQTLDEQLFAAESKVIREIAEKESAVFVGRCADYVLEGLPDKFDFFIYGSMEYRLAQVEQSEYYTFGGNSAETFLNKIDRQRAAYYNFFTGRTWGKGSQYDLCISSERLGIEGTAQYLSEYVKAVQGRRD